MDSLKKINRLSTVILLMAFTLSLGFASTLVTAEDSTIGGIARAMSMYQALNNGQTPTNWTQIGQVYDLQKINRKLEGSQSHPIEDRYQFITQPMSFPNYEGSQVLLIRTVPLENLSEADLSKRRQWRYLVTRSKDGEITSTSLPEPEVQAMLKSANVTLVPKEGLPKVETDEPLLLQGRTDGMQELASTERQSPMAQSAIPLVSESTSPQRASPASTPPAEAKSSMPPFPIAPVVIIAAVIVGVIVFLRRRKSP